LSGVAETLHRATEGQEVQQQMHLCQRDRPQLAIDDNKRIMLETSLTLMWIEAHTEGMSLVDTAACWKDISAVGLTFDSAVERHVSV